MKPGLKPPNITRHYQRNEHNDLVRREENRLLGTLMGEINRRNELHMLAGLLANEEHLMIMLAGCPRRERYAKYEGMRPYLRFKTEPIDVYEARRIERDFNKFTHMAS